MPEKKELETDGMVASFCDFLVVLVVVVAVLCWWWWWYRWWWWYSCCYCCHSMYYYCWLLNMVIINKVMKYQRHASGRLCIFQGLAEEIGLERR